MAPMAPDRTLAMGTELHAGKFTVGRVLGEGGFGITYKGAHKSLQRAVAIKELFPEGAVRLGANVSLPQSRQADFKHEMDSILQEARIIASLRSSTIVDVHDMFQENGTAYIVMEYLEGQTLQEAIDRQGPLPSDRVQAIALDTCAALAEVHSNHLLHRDIKPANIVLTHDGRTVLIDFGSAREFKVSHTAHHTRILTEEYAAPEQYSTQARFGPYTDIFCLGATLFHGLTGAPPPRALDRLQNIAPSLVFPDGVGAALRSAIQQALNLKVQERPQTIQAFQGLLRDADHAPHDGVLVISPGTVAAGKGGGTPRSAAPVSSSFTTSPPQTPDLFNASSERSHPYFFKGQPFHSPSELAAALAQDWDAALSDWQRGYIRTWMTRDATGNDFERGIDNMLEDPLFRDAGFNAYTPAASSSRQTDTPDIAVLERQLLRVLSLMDPAWPPSYRSMPLQDKFALREWLAGSRDKKLVNRCLRHQILLAHPKKFGRQLHKNLQQQAQICHRHLAQRGLLAADMTPNSSKHFTGWWNSESSRIYKLQILGLLTGAETPDPVCTRMQQDRKAMRVRWFRELVAEATHSAGCAVALVSLQPKARSVQNRNNFITALIVVIALWIIGSILLGF